MQTFLPNLGIRHAAGSVRVKYDFVIDQNPSAGGRLQKIQSAKKGRLNASRRTDHGQSLSLFQSEADILKDFCVLERFTDMLYL